jgi:hypothetical protein
VTVALFVGLCTGQTSTGSIAGPPPLCDTTSGNYGAVYTEDFESGTLGTFSNTPPANIAAPYAVNVGNLGYPGLNGANEVVVYDSDTGVVRSPSFIVEANQQIGWLQAGGTSSAFPVAGNPDDAATWGGTKMGVNLEEQTSPGVWVMRENSYDTFDTDTLSTIL